MSNRVNDDLVTLAQRKSATYALGVITLAIALLCATGALEFETWKYHRLQAQLSSCESAPKIILRRFS